LSVAWPGGPAAARARRLSEDAEIVVFERGRTSFANCGLPYYLGGEIAQPRQAPGRHAGAAAGRYRLDGHPDSVEAIDRAQAKKVRVRS
jgi:NADPH-dependent 2,4-dienoyl-CoA reductase/sulfur reductase-like enzyme